VKNLTWLRSILLPSLLFASGIQSSLAEGYLYLFSKDFPPGDFTAVEAVQTEQSEGNLKLTTADGKLTVWGANLVAAKYPLFDERKEAADPAAMQALIDSMEKFIAEQPGSKNYLQTPINQRKELLARLQNKAVENVQTTEDALGRFLSDAYEYDRTYSIDYLEAKIRRGDQFKQEAPDQTDKITEYLKPWAEELKYRKQGMERYEGKWQTVEAIARIKEGQSQAEKKAFLEKISFKIPQVVFTQTQVYIFLAVFALSALILLVLAFNGLSNVSGGLSLSVLFSLLFGLGGLGLYGFGIWCLFSPPSSYTSLSSSSSLKDSIPLDELMYRVSGSANAPAGPSRYLVDDPAINTFLKQYLKIDDSGKADAYAVTRKGLKVRILVDRILIFDELSWCKKDIVACYTLYYTSTSQDISIYKNEATLGSVPMPGKMFKFVWEQQIQPLVTEVFNTSRVFDTYHISRMEGGMVEFISGKNPPKVPKS